MDIKGVSMTFTQEIEQHKQIMTEQKNKIKELEQENNKLLDVINNQDVKIADLEKRNGKLAGQKASLQRWLGEAKKIIKQFSDTCKMATAYPSEINIKPVWIKMIEQAEQFLKKVK